MNEVYPLVPLSEVLTERQEIPSIDSLVKGEISVIEKIGFNDGHVQLRTNSTTKTNMILIQPGYLVVSGINAAKGAIAIFDEKNILPIAATIHYSSYKINKEKADINYLWFLLRSHKFKELLLEYLPGGIKTELKAKRFLPLPIPLPPLEEQRRIDCSILYEGALVLSQVKGWEGAIGVCPSNLVGRYVSPEYRTFRCIPGKAIREYLSVLVATT